MLFSLLHGLALASLASNALAAFNADSKTNVAVYWGQGPNQQRLIETCKSSSVDIVNVGFINAFPDNSPGGYPGLNLGNACGDQTYTVNGVATLLKSNCANLEADIVACQKTYGKKVFLSLGGGVPTNYYITSDTSANSFADFLWGAFGPATAAWTNAGKPRPFGTASVDGFDFDIESEISPVPKDSSGNDITDYKSRGYATLINRLKNTLFGQDTSKRYYISAAPQCPLPDQHLSSVISAAWVDFVFVQFYNNPSCSARAMINYAAGDSLLHWTQAASKNTAVKIYVGLPAHPAAASTTSDYLTQAEVQNIVQRFSSYPKWGGIMLWESTYSQVNVACGSNYATWVKSILGNTISGSALPGDINACSIIPPTVLAPGPTQEGIIPTCNKYLITNSVGAQCSIFAPRAGITEAQLYAWNTILGDKGQNCATKFLGNTYYCVGVATPTAAPAPGPTQTGIINTCNKYAMANPGGSCPVFANRVGISEAQLYAWNTVLGSTGQNCASSFWGNTYYCVGVSGSTSVPALPQPTPTGAAPAPGPTQSGVINTCNKYAMANPGGSCPVFANRVGITLAQLYAWNTVLGANGQNCASSFWGNTYYCVGVRASKVRRDEIDGYAYAPQVTPTPYYEPTASSSAVPTYHSTANESTALSVTSDIIAPAPSPYIATSLSQAPYSVLPSSIESYTSSSSSVVAPVYSLPPAYGASSSSPAASSASESIYTPKIYPSLTVSSSSSSALVYSPSSIYSWSSSTTIVSSISSVFSASSESAISYAPSSYSSSLALSSSSSSASIYSSSESATLTSYPTVTSLTSLSSVPASAAVYSSSEAPVYPSSAGLNSTGPAYYASSSSDLTFSTYQTPSSVLTSVLPTFSSVSSVSSAITSENTEVPTYGAPDYTSSANSQSSAPAFATAPASYPPAAPSTMIYYSTTVDTITSCAPSVTDCPAHPESQSTIQLTKTIALTSTVYPVSTATEASEYPGAPYSYLAAGSPAPTTTMSSTTTSWTTVYVTVTGCPPSVSDCEQHTGVNVAMTLTTSYPVTASLSASVIAPADYSTQSHSTSAATISASPPLFSYAPSQAQTSSSENSKATTAPIPVSPNTSANGTVPYSATSLTHSSSSLAHPAAYSGASSSAQVRVSTMYVIPVQYTSTVSAVLPTGYASASGASAPSGTGAVKPPTYSGPAIEPFTGAAWRKSVGLGFITVVVGAIVVLL